MELGTKSPPIHFKWLHLNIDGKFIILNNVNIYKENMMKEGSSEEEGKRIEIYKKDDNTEICPGNYYFTPGHVVSFGTPIIEEIQKMDIDV